MANAWMTDNAKARYIFLRSIISVLVFSKLKRLETENIFHKIIEDIQGERPVEKTDSPRKVPPMLALVNSNPLAIVSFTLRAFERSTKGSEILLPKT